MTPTGTIFRVLLPERSPRGREQSGERPVVVAADPDSLGRARFPMLLVVPLTTQHGAWAVRGGRLYPSLAKGAGGLPADSVALLDHLTDLDPARILGRVGLLTPQEYAPVQDGLRALFGPTPAPGAGRAP